MKMKKISMFFGILAALFVSQSAWAAAGDKTTDSQTWSAGQLEATIQSGKSVMTTSNNFVKFTLTGDEAISFTSTVDISWGGNDDRLLVFDECKANEQHNLAFTWEKVMTGYSLNVTTIRTLSAMAGTFGYYKLGSADEVAIAKAAGATSVCTSPVSAGATSLPLYFRRGTLGTSRFMGVPHHGYITKISYEYQIIPDAPVWSQASDVMDVTVDNVNGQHLYNLASKLQVANPAFAGTVKYEITSNNAKYVFWNSDHNAFYVLKSGEYKVKAYIEKVDGQYCSSVYSEEFTITASVKEEEKENAKIYFFMDGMLAEEKDPINHVWEITMPMDTARHYVEYVSVDPTAMSFERSEKNITYLTDTDPLSDHFKMKTTLGDDSIKISQGNKRAWLWINITGAGSNHLPYTVGEAEFNNGSIVITTDRVRWDAAHSDIEFEGNVTPITKARTVEFAFTGVPDSVKFTYNTNAAVNRENVRLKLSYAAEPGQWVEVAQVAAPSSSSAAFDAKCAFAIPANAKYVQLQYYNAENSGWVRNFTITEKKAITFPQDTLIITGVHTPDGVATKSTSLSWYNVLDSLSWSVSGLGQNDKFSVNSSKIQTQLDSYRENIPYEVKYKLDEPGIHYSSIMFWSQDRDASHAFTTIAHYIVKGITAYGEKEIVVDNDLPEDTVIVNPGEVVPNPFVVKDTAGNELPAELKDSVKYEYTITPAEAATVDENGNIMPNCVGVVRIIAALQPNSVVPAATDTIYLDVPEASKNVINWTLPTQIGKGDTLPSTMAATEDGAAIEYEFIPASMVQTVEGGFQLIEAGEMSIVAKAGQTCGHLAMSDTIDVIVRGIVSEMAPNQQIDIANIHVLDTLKDLIIVKDENGDTLKAPEVQIQYAIEPSEKAHVDENGNIVIDHVGDVTITATVLGDTIKTISQTFDLNFKSLNEEIYCTLPDSILKDHVYDLKNIYSSTRSQLGIDTVYVPESYESMFSFDGCTITPLQNGKVRLIMVANGNEDFVGPVKFTKEVTIVGGVKDIKWEEELEEELENAQIGDTIHTSQVPVYDENGEEIIGAEKSYEIIPEDAAHVTPEGDIVVDKMVDPITIIVTTEKDGKETKKDTLQFATNPISISDVEFPKDVDDALENAHVGDTIPMSTPKVYDQNGKDITDQMDKIEYIIEPEDAAHFEKVGTDSVLVIDKDMPFEIITKITDPLVDPDHATDTAKVDVQTYTVGEVVLPTIPGHVLQPGESFNVDDIVITDKDGNDITDLADVIIEWSPVENAHMEGNELVIDKAGDITITTKISGEGIAPIEKTEQIHVDKFIPEDAEDFELPEPQHENGYQIGDELPISLKDKDGKDITDFTDFNVTIEPADKAHFDAEKGAIVLDQEGPVDFTITVGGDNVEPYSYNEQIYIHHNETGCYDLMVQIWSDVAIINNNNQTANFVRYEWYKNGALVANQNGQDYHEPNGAAMNGIYYAYAYDAAGNKFMICEKEFSGTASNVSARMLQVYPTMVTSSNLYTIETEMEGEVFISTGSGVAAQHFSVEAGKNSIHAPFAQGVYMIRFVAADGKAASQKLIVK